MTPTERFWPPPPPPTTRYWAPIPAQGPQRAPSGGAEGSQQARGMSRLAQEPCGSLPPSTGPAGGDSRGLRVVVAGPPVYFIRKNHFRLPDPPVQWAPRTMRLAWTRGVPKAVPCRIPTAENRSARGSAGISIFGLNLKQKSKFPQVHELSGSGAPVFGQVGA